MIKDFLRYMAYEKRLSQHTIISYENDLNKFSLYLQENAIETPVHLVSPNELRQWIIYLSEEEMAITSINRKIACLKSFFKFCLKRGTIEKDPTEKLKTLKKPKRVPKFIPEDQLNHFLDQLSHLPEDFQGLRDRLILELLYGTGIRRAELIELKSEQIDKKNYTVRVRGKGNKIRLIPLNSTLRELIPRYEEQKLIEFSGNTCEFLIVTNSGKQSYPTFIYKKVKEYLEIFKTIDQKSPHILRHTFATHLLNRGADLNAIKDLLGHSSLSATQVYTHNSIGKLKDVFNQAHPKAEEDIHK
ncbi:MULTISPECIES: tyrosine-type recombinase/integrase [Persicobacter]|uniref:Tyrosine recombinase XerC n=1 Tax=Persicobacter diffluens TaxID=981 RepID=A0AAN5AHV8_9BACT|nr:tyrosine-type recombinase/integrase [Persicobacter sp. CCB-QB2]GJM59725.1 integrase [Persicobacter diffluens]